MFSFKLRKKRLFHVLRCNVAAILFGILTFPSISHASLFSIRVPVTSFVSEDGEAPDDGNPGSPGDLTVRFYLEPTLTRRLPKGDSRIGLFLKIESDVIAGMGRGKLKDCTSGFCSATFPYDRKLEFYQDYLDEPANWYLMVLQSPNLEERLNEALSEEDKSGPPDLSFECGLQGLTLEENSSTSFNSQKSTNKWSFGRKCSARYNTPLIALAYEQYGVNLSTLSFFEETFDTRYAESSYLLKVRYRISPSVTFWGGGVYRTSSFVTPNDDFEIISSENAVALMSADVSVDWNTELLSISEGFWGLYLDRSVFSTDFSVWGSVADTGDFIRGTSGSYSEIRIGGTTGLISKSKSFWLNNITLHLSFVLDFYDLNFSGTADGPSFSLEDNTQASGRRVFWGFSVGRKFEFGDD